MTSAAGSLPTPAPRALAAPTAVGSLAWRWTIGALVLVIWLIPVKSYRLPVTLPFNLEVYRLMIIVMLFAWLLASLNGRGRLSAGGAGGAVALLALGAVASVLTNMTAVEAQGLATQALKTLSYFLSFLLAFVLISSTINTFRDVETITATIVIGAVIVALCALVEYRTRYNVFDHLQTWIPILRQDRSQGVFLRNGRLRVYASSQHPIALGAALIMSTPLAFYLARRATATHAKRLWQLAALVIAAGAAATQSRTVVSMVGAMIIVGLWLRRQSVVRHWPLLIVVLGAIHVASPSTLGDLYHAFLPKSGLIGEQETRAGLTGSGRLADLGPGFRMWKAKPLLGHGLGTEPTAGTAAAENPTGRSTSPASSIIFDDQYMTSLVEAGAVGFIGVLWLVIGVFLKMGRVAKTRWDLKADLLAAYTITCAGFAVGMVTYDAFSFVQVTLLFFLCAALGLRVRELILQGEADTATSPGGRPAVL